MDPLSFDQTKEQSPYFPKALFPLVLVPWYRLPCECCPSCRVCHRHKGRRDGLLPRAMMQLSSLPKPTLEPPLRHRTPSFLPWPLLGPLFMPPPLPLPMPERRAVVPSKAGDRAVTKARGTAVTKAKDTVLPFTMDATTIPDKKANKMGNR